MTRFFINAGDRRERIEFKKIVTAENDYGEPVEESRDLIGKARAQVNYGRGTERRQAGLEGNDQAATFRVRKGPSVASVTTKDVIEYEGVTWDITSIAPLGDIGFDFTAVRRQS